MWLAPISTSDNLTKLPRFSGTSVSWFPLMFRYVRFLRCGTASFGKEASSHEPQLRNCRLVNFDMC